MLATILTFIMNLVGGPFLKAAENVFEARYKAQVDQGKISADLEAQKANFDLQREALEQQTLRDEQARWFPLVRWSFAFPFIVYDWKVVIWDIVLHKGVTDHLSPEFLQLHMIITAAYFGSSMLKDYVSRPKGK